MLRSPCITKYNYYKYYNANKEKYRLRYEEKKAKEQEYVGNYYIDYWKKCKWRDHN